MLQSQWTKKQKEVSGLHCTLQAQPQCPFPPARLEVPKVLQPSKTGPSVLTHGPVGAFHIQTPYVATMALHDHDACPPSIPSCPSLSSHSCLGLHSSTPSLCQRPFCFLLPSQASSSAWAAGEALPPWFHGALPLPL